MKLVLQKVARGYEYEAAQKTTFGHLLPREKKTKNFRLFTNRNECWLAHII